VSATVARPEPIGPIIARPNLQLWTSGRLAGRYPASTAGLVLGSRLLQRLVGHCWRVYQELADRRSQTNSHVWIFPLIDVGGVAKMIRFP
jgi:hypothetical protein